MHNDPSRSQSGRLRVVCDCAECTRCCKFMPGFLVPSDLDRLIPAHNSNVLAWARANLRASPGAIVMKDGVPFRIPTLVPAGKGPDDPSCVWLTAEGRCSVHADAPAGCAFFARCQPRTAADDRLSGEFLTQVAAQWADPGDSLYVALWMYLAELGLTSDPPEVKRARMAAAGRDS